MADMQVELVKDNDNTSEKICPKCGQSNPSTQIFCGKCGTKLDIAPKKQINPLVIVIPAAAIIVIGIIITVILLTNTPQKKFERFVEKGDYSAAIEVYNKNSGKSEFKAVATAYLTNIAPELLQKYANGEITTDEINSTISTLSPVYNFSSINEDVMLLSESKAAFAEAESKANNKEYIEAIELFKSVIEKDIKNYPNVQNKVNECIDSYSAFIIEEADKTISDNQSEESYVLASKKLTEAIETGYTNDTVNQRFESLEKERKDFVCKSALDKAEKENSPISAYDQLLKVNEKDRNDNFNSELNKYGTKAEEYFADKMKEHTDKKEYDKAFQFYNKQSKGIKALGGVKSLYDAIKKEYVDSMLAQAKSYADKGNYTQAVKILNTAEESVSDTSLSTKKKTYQREGDKAYLESAKGYFVDVVYDDIYSAYYINPYSTNYLGDFSSKYTIRPILYLKNNNIAYELQFGFTRQEWIFMDKIIVDGDGFQFKYPISRNERITEVLNYSIMEEWSAIDKNSTQGVTGANKEYDFSDLISQMEKSNEVKIRFSGSKGHCDKTLPQDEINRITVYWHVYQILLRNPDLKSYVIG